MAAGTVVVSRTGQPAASSAILGVVGVAAHGGGVPLAAELWGPPCVAYPTSPASAASSASTATAEAAALATMASPFPFWAQQQAQQPPLMEMEILPAGQGFAAVALGDTGLPAARRSQAPVLPPPGHAWSRASACAAAAAPPQPGINSEPAWAPCPPGGLPVQPWAEPMGGSQAQSSAAYSFAAVQPGPARALPLDFQEQLAAAAVHLPAVAAAAAAAATWGQLPDVPEQLPPMAVARPLGEPAQPAAAQAEDGGRAGPLPLQGLQMRQGLPDWAAAAAPARGQSAASSGGGGRFASAPAIGVNWGGFPDRIALPSANSQQPAGGSGSGQAEAAAHTSLPMDLDRPATSASPQSWPTPFQQAGVPAQAGLAAQRDGNGADAEVQGPGMPVPSQLAMHRSASAFVVPPPASLAAADSWVHLLLEEWR